VFERAQSFLAGAGGLHFVKLIALLIAFARKYQLQNVALILFIIRSEEHTSSQGLRRNHRSDTVIGPSAESSCDTGGGAYVFERDAQGQWRHVAAAIEPLVAGQVGTAFSADAQTLVLDAFERSTLGTSLSIH
jgi:hypothetical protein